MKMKLERRLVRLALLAAVLVAVSVAVVALWQQGGTSPVAWATIAAVMAVVAAITSAWTSQRLVELQEDAGAPNLQPSFDLRSRYSMAQFQLVNKGGSPAFNIKITFDKPLKHQDGHTVQLAGGNAIPVLLPGESSSVSLGTSHALFNQHDDTSVSVTIQFTDASGSIQSKTCKVSAEHERSSLVHTREELRTHYDIQQIPGALKEIANAISRYRNEP